MSANRTEYFVSLLEDCTAAVDSVIKGDDAMRAAVVAALIISDSYNGLRKALLQAAAVVAEGGRS